MPSRRQFLTLSSGLILTPLIGGAAFGQSGATQVAGVYRRGVGDVTVTALLDGYLELDPNMLVGSDADANAQLLEAAFLPNAPVQTSVNGYVVQYGSQTVLVDGGAASAFGPTLGKMGAALDAAGVTPEDVDIVFCTHLHPDHIGAFTDGDGAAAFPNAQFYVHEADHAFWTNADNFSAMPEMMQNFAAMAQACVAAYGDRVIIQKDGASVVGGVTVKHMPGHTPGHSGLMVDSKDQQLLIWGDIVHVGPIQFARPQVTIPFDVDQTQAAQTRASVFDMVATDRLEVAGAHIDFPSFGHIEKAGDGYRFVNSRWDHVL